MQRTDIIDTDGENKAIRSFLRYYLKPGISIGEMRDNMAMAGWDGCWPESLAAADWNSTLTKFETQTWLRHLFGLDAKSPQEVRYLQMRADAVLVPEGITGRVTVSYRIPTNYRDYTSASELLDACVDAALADTGLAAQGALASEADRVESARNDAAHPTVAQVPARLSHEEYVAGCDEGQLENLIERANVRLEKIRSSGWVKLWTVSIGWSNVAWFAEQEYGAAVDFARAAVGNEALRLPGKAIEMEVKLERYRPEEVAGLLAATPKSSAAVGAERNTEG